MTAPVVSLLPETPGGYLPAASPPAGLTDDEQRLIVGLSTKMSAQWPTMLLRDLYYRGEQRLTNIGVLVPAQLSQVRVVVGWPGVCVDRLHERCVLDGFRTPDETDADEELAALWAANDLYHEAPLAWLDALVFRCGYMIVGAPDYDGGAPLVTVESPANIATVWDPRTRRTTAAYQAYQVEGVTRGVLYLPDQTIAMSRDQSGSMWTVDDRDLHGFGEVPVVKFVNRQRAGEREGRSEITPAIMATTDSTMRTLLGAEVAREFYSIPHRYILGANESDFQAADGTARTALDMVMSKMLAFERDASGEVPQVGQFQAYDPSVFTKLVQMNGQLMSGYTGFPPEYFGLTTTANPASGDAIRAAENGIDRRAGMVTRQFTRPSVQVAQLLWRFANGGAPLPDPMRQLTADWLDVRTPTPAADADAVFKKVQMGAVPPTSDVVLQELGYNELQRRRLAADRAVDAGGSILAQLANSLQAKEARADVTVARDINPAAARATTQNPSGDSPGIQSGR